VAIISLRHGLLRAQQAKEDSLACFGAGDAKPSAGASKVSLSGRC